MNHETAQYVALAKRKCALCHTYRFFAKSENEKKACLDALNGAYNSCRYEFEELRKASTPDEAIAQWRENKKLILDAVDVCKKCDKELTLAKNKLSEMR